MACALSGWGLRETTYMVGHPGDLIVSLTAIEAEGRSFESRKILFSLTIWPRENPSCVYIQFVENPRAEGKLNPIRDGNVIGFFLPDGPTYSGKAQPKQANTYQVKALYHKSRIVSNILFTHRQRPPSLELK